MSKKIYIDWEEGEYFVREGWEKRARVEVPDRLYEKITNLTNTIREMQKELQPILRVLNNYDGCLYNGDDDVDIVKAFENLVKKFED